MFARTGPVYPVVGSVNAPQPGSNASIAQQPGDVFYWATVVSQQPLQIQQDGSAQATPGTPSALVADSALVPGTRVWVQRHGYLNVIVNIANGGLGPMNATVQAGFSVRDNNSIYQPQVIISEGGMVSMWGQMNCAGIQSITADTVILQLPQGYWPSAQQWWIGYPTPTPSKTIGGYVHTTGQVYIRVEAATVVPSDGSGYFPLIVQSWIPQPAPAF